jgi:hypothetical protein
MPAIKQSPDGTFGIDGYGSPAGGGFIPIAIEYGASSIDKSVFIATRRYRVKAVSGCPTVAGSDGGAVTAAVMKTSATTAIASGTAVHASTINLKGVAETVQNMTVTTTSDADLIEAGDRIGVNFTGTLTDAVGCITVVLCPA